MKKKIAILLAALLFLKVEDVETALGDMTDDDFKEDELKKLFDTYGEGHKIHTNDDHDRLLENTSTEYVKQLAEGSDPIPTNLHGRVVGEIREQEETKLKEKYDFSGDFRGLADLIDKVIDAEKVKAVGDDPEADETLKKLNKELGEKNEELKALIKTNKVEAETKLSEAVNASDTDIIDRDLQAAVASLNIDSEDDADTDTEARKHITSAFKGDHKLAREDGKTVVLKADGTRVNDDVGDPMSVNEAVKASVPSFIKLLDGPGGGRGTGSSGDNGDGSPKINSMEEYNALREKREIKVNSVEDAALMKEVREGNPDFNPHLK